MNRQHISAVYREALGKIGDGGWRTQVIGRADKDQREDDQPASLSQPHDDQGRAADYQRDTLQQNSTSTYIDERAASRIRGKRRKEKDGGKYSGV